MRRSAYLNLEDHNKERFIQNINEVTNWESLIHAAEKAALTNVLYKHITSLGISVPEEALRQFKALKVRQLRAHRIRSQELHNILEQFNQENIHAILLKGAALTHVLYDSPEMRPMSDIDLLVHPDQADSAQAALRKIGFNAADRKQGYGFDHHHLPIASKFRDGMSVNVEVHHSALSGDATSQIDMECLQDKPVQFSIDHHQAWSLGHIDQLRHLCHHMFEPIEVIKLGSVVDLYGYIEKFSDQINWQKLNKEFPFVINTIRCLHFLTPIPSSLESKITPPTTPAPQGVGLGFVPMSDTFRQNRDWSSRIKALLNCSDWWLHIYYQVPPESSLSAVKNFTHPKQIMKWIVRRIKANLRSKLVKT